METYTKAFEKLDTTCISDALDRLGIAGVPFGVKPAISGVKMCGTAFTVRYVPCGVEKGTVGDFLDDVATGQVVVIDNGGRLNCTVWGDIMTVFSREKGISGTVIDGVCRDMPRIRELKYPIFTKGYYISTGKDRVEVAEVGGTVSVSDIQVKAGDIIVGDDSGIVVVPWEKAGEVLKIATEIDEKEDAILASLKNGKTLRQAREEADYHHLQTLQGR